MKLPSNPPLSLRPVFQHRLSTFTVVFLILSGWSYVLVGPGTAASQQEAPLLEVGKAVEKPLAGGETRNYRVAAQAEQFLRVVVQQRGIDVKVTIFAPDGKSVLEVDSPNGDQGPETASLISQAAGEYRVEIKSEDAKAKAGRYEVKLEALRPPTEADRNRVTAERLMIEAEQLRGERNPASQRNAVQKFEEALPLWRLLNDQSGQADALNNIGDLYRSSLNEPRRAMESYQQALPLSRALGDKDGEAATLNNLGVVYHALGERERAIEYLNQSLPLRRAIKDRLGEAITLTALGKVYIDLGQKRRALDYYQRSLALRRAAGERQSEALALNDIAVAYTDLGEIQKALDYYNQALPLRRDARGRAITLMNMGRAYDLLGATQEAIGYYNQALQLVRSISEKRGESQILNFIGLANWSTGDYAKSLEAFDQALKLKRELKDRLGEAETLNNIGRTYDLTGEQQKAIDYYAQALPVLREAGNRQGEAATLNNLGFAHESLGNESQALGYQQQALKASQDSGDRLREAKVRFGIAHIESSLNRLKPARNQVEQTIKIVESLRQKLASPELRAAYRASVQQYYDLYIDVLMRQGKRLPRGVEQNKLVAEALQVSERARARSLIELLTEAGADIRQGVDAKLVERERELQEQINDKTTEQIRLLATRAKAEQIAAAGKEIEQLNGDLRDVQGQIRATSPRYAGLTQPQPLTIRQIQSLLDANTMLLEFSLGEERSYLWAVTPAAVHSFALPKRAEIEAAAKRFYDLATARNQFVAKETSQQKQDRIAQADQECLTAAGSLGRLLFAPVTPLLGNKRLVIVADGALQYVPFGVLPIRVAQSSKPLIVNHEINLLPSASTLAVLRGEAAQRQQASKTVAVIADPVFEAKDERVKLVTIKADAGKPGAQNDKPTTPPATAEEPSRILLYKSAKDSGAGNAEFRIPRLPNTRREAETILSLAGSSTGKATFDFAASRAAATSEDLGQYRILHFATHGFLNSLNPELSGLVLSMVDEQGKPQNGYLLAPEIYNLKLPATELVVLSACQTGLGKEVRGEGVVGLTRGFMYAGAPRVVVSLWSVNDRSTADLMKYFYEAMLTKGQRPSAALRSAQIQLLQSKQWQAPYYWAAFGLQGEWK